MANTILTPSIIARSAIATLYANAVMPGLVHRDYDRDFDTNVNGYKQGNTVTINKPATFTAEAYNRVAGLTVQNATETSDTVTLDTVADVSFAITAEELTLDIDRFRERFLVPAMEAIWQKIDVDLIGLRADVTASVGVDNTAPTDPTIIVDAVKLLNDAKVPMTQRYGVWSTIAQANFMKDPLFHQADQRGDTEGLREASIGRKFGVDHFMDQNIGATGVGAAGDNLIFHREAFCLAMRPLALPMGATNAAVESYKGFSLRTVIDYDIDQKQDVVSIDCLYGVKTLDADKAVKVLG